MVDSIKTGGEITDSEYFGPIDMARTKALMFGIYHTDTATRERFNGWYDPPSADMLETYLRLYGGFAPVLQEHGDSARANESIKIAEKVRTAITGH